MNAPWGLKPVPSFLAPLLPISSLHLPQSSALEAGAVTLTNHFPFIENSRASALGQNVGSGRLKKRILSSESAPAELGGEVSGLEDEEVLKV